MDVCIVGGGPAGLCAAIRLKQLEAERGGDELRVVVLEKGGEVGEYCFHPPDCATCISGSWRMVTNSAIKVRISYLGLSSRQELWTNFCPIGKKMAHL